MTVEYAELKLMGEDRARNTDLGVSSISPKENADREKMYKEPSDPSNLRGLLEKKELPVK